MENASLRIIPSIVILTIIFAGCGNIPSSTFVPSETRTPEAIPIEISLTLDPCSPGQIEAIVQRVHSHMREFDDASYLAAALTQAQLGEAIADLQRIRREAEDEQIPACLITLKDYQIQHMNAAINSFIAIMRLSSGQAIDCSNSANNAEQQTLCQNYTLAGQYHNQYLLELARLLGLTAVPATPIPLGQPLESATP